MEFRKFQDKYIVRLNKGDEIISSITDLCRNENIKLGNFIGLGAANKATIGLYDTEEKAVSYTHLDVYKRQEWQREPLLLTDSLIL